MVRKLTRHERIEYEMWNNKVTGKSSLEQSRGYCEALVDGMIAVENQTEEYKMTNDKPKAKMTRAEAFKCCEAHMPWLSVAQVDHTIDFYIEAGMLEIVEEISPREKFRQACSDLGHDEATVYGHWALAAYDKAHDTKFLIDTPTLTV